jgi:hypothetical protein
MRRVALALVLVAVPASARDTIGIFGRWGAFRDPAPSRCFAISEPVEAIDGGRWRAFASVASWPGQRVRGQLHIRLSRMRDPRARVTLSIGERRFELIAGDADAWARDRRTDFAIVSAMRAGRSMSVETLSRTGSPFADAYALTGAATAIDAAAAACTVK